MSAHRAAAGAIALAVCLCGCERRTAPQVEGVAPDRPVKTSEPAPRKLVLAEPGPEAFAPEPAATPPPPAPAPAPPSSGLADIGPLEVISWDEARKQAEKRITPENADAELKRLAGEIEGRP